MPKTLEIIEEQNTATEEGYKLILWNDKYNRFVWLMY